MFVNIFLVAVELFTVILLSGFFCLNLRQDIVVMDFSSLFLPGKVFISPILKVPLLSSLVVPTFVYNESELL